VPVSDVTSAPAFHAAPPGALPAPADEFALETAAADELPRVGPLPQPWRHPLRAAAWTVRVAFGLTALWLLLAVLAAVPVVNLWVLGYLLEAEGRVARTGRLHNGIPLLGLAPRLGGVVLGVGFWLLPLLFIGSYAADARLIDPQGAVAVGWSKAGGVLTVLVALHLLLAVARGGTPGCFVRPLKNGLWLVGRVRRRGVVGVWRDADDRLAAMLALLEPARLWWVGLRAFFAGLAWVAPPTMLLLAADSHRPATLLVALAGGLVLAVVLGWVPILQARFAVTDRTRALFGWRAARRAYNQAPLAWTAALVLTYLLALPLYLAKVALPPRDAVFLLTPLFLLGVWPARIVSGWALARSLRRESPAGWGWRWGGRLVALAALAAFVFVLYFTQYVGAHGRLVLFQHHALLLPVPF
jgi:hypothetical protein